jgi:hypothetical protein
MIKKRAETATPHLREAPEKQKQVEHEDAIGDVDPLKFGILRRRAATSQPHRSHTAATPSAARRTPHSLLVRWVGVGRDRSPAAPPQC